METGARVWIHDTEEIWQAGIIEECNESDTNVRVRVEDGSIVSSLAGNVYLRNDHDDFTDVPNLISLQYLHEPELLHAVCNRYEHDLIYTYVGEILLALNPFQRLNIYSSNHVQQYAAAADASEIDMSLPPHVFAIAANAYKSLCEDKKDQSILVSGESGAGKTENTKFLMQYLTQVGALDAETAAAAASPPKPNKRSKSKATASTAQIQTQILQTNPILEAFGNARTVRNDNSSRFGKFIELQFGSHHKIVGAKLSVYLLEKIRVSHQSQDERNFHIFYELCAGADDDLATELSLSDAEDFDLLNESGCFTRRDGVDDADQFQLTSQAFTDMGIPEDEQRSIYGIVAALLHLGNVSFCAKMCQATNMDQACVEDEKPLDLAASLLGVSSAELTRALMTRHVATTKDKIEVKLTAAQASEAKQSLTQSLYGGLFKWIVNRLSMIIRHDSASVNTVGILDIFGFENLTTNGFEQLCINYANERLQAQFNELVFAKEQRMYESEGIEWKYIEYPDNAPCLQLLEDRPHGMWCLLDEEGMLPKGSNEGWISKLYSVFLDDDSVSSLDFKQTRLRRQSEPVPKTHTPPQLTTQSSKPFRPFYATNGQRVEFQFVIGHFAGRVMYENDSFLQKNQDALPPEAIDLCGSSSNPIVQALLQAAPVNNKAKKASAKPLVRQPSNLRSSSVSAQFKSQLDDLIQVIGRTQARYIRCIKSNEKGQPRLLNKPRVVQQLRSGGVLEAVRIARAGYAVRVDHLSFMDAFGFFNHRKSSVKKDTKGQCEQTVAAVMLQFYAHDATIVAIATQVLKAPKYDRVAFQEACGHAGFQIGNSKIFFRKDVYNDMRRFRRQTLARHATTIHRHLRGFVARVIFARKKAAVTALQAWMRACLAYRAMRRRAATTIQAWGRRLVAQIKLQKARRATQQLQRWLRDRSWKRKLSKKVALRKPKLPPTPPPSPPASLLPVKSKSSPEKRQVQPVQVVVVAEPVAEPVVAPPPSPPPTVVTPVVQLGKAPKSSTPPPSAHTSTPPVDPAALRQVDSLVVSLSVENAQLKQRLEALQKEKKLASEAPALPETNPSLEFAHHQLRTLSTQLAQLQMQCAMLEDVDQEATSVDLDIPQPTSLVEAQKQLHSLLHKVKLAKQHLEELEVQQLHLAKARAEEAQALALLEAITPVVTTVRNVASYVPVVSYVVARVEAKTHVTPQTWCMLLQTSQSVVKSMASMASQMLTRKSPAALPPPVDEMERSPMVVKLKQKVDALMELHVDQAIEIKELKAQLQESTIRHQSMQMKFLEDKLTHLMHDMRTHDDDKMKRMEEELAYTTACVNQLANAIVRGPLKDKHHLDSFDLHEPIVYHHPR
ncbi:unnamed protein product [Aphanomyces euteiches]|nr:hypothetical protein AeRB84_004077 [Aphanomyces euteiches]